MITKTVGEFKAKFSEVIEEIKKGNEVVISYGKKREKLAVLVPFNKYKPKKRQIGIMDGKAFVEFSEDFKITDEEFLNS
ncbi:MAG: type II toxin-antitoxin system Phd/YefM family antitoxin [Thermodesulfobacteriota bacterium]